MARPATLFRSFFLGGFECSTHLAMRGMRLDLISSTKHDRFVEKDYGGLLEKRILTARDGLRWPFIETSPRKYDFSSAILMLHAARKTGLQVIWDLLHFGWPDFLDVFKPEFVAHFEAFTSEFIKIYSQETDQPPLFAPANEISFLSWAGADVGIINPFTKGRGDEMKHQLVRAATAASAIILDRLPHARLVFPEPVIHIIAQKDRPQDAEAAEGYRRSMFQAWDMLSGRSRPELGGQRRYLDIIGLNFYPRNEWYHNSGPIFRNEPEYKPFREIAAEVYERYRRPLFVAETGTEDEDRPAWFRYVVEESLAAREQGVAMEGVCLYPIANHPGWEDDRHCYNGLFDYADDSGNRTVYRPLEEELTKQTSIVANFLQKEQNTPKVPALLCLSHLRWQFVFQRPQHLMSRFAKRGRVFFIEEPVADSGLVKENCYTEVRVCPHTGVHIATPHLAEGLPAQETEDVQRRLLNELIAEERIGPFILWYYTPMALEFSSHLKPVATIYDCMDELSAFKGAPAHLKLREKELLERADLVFTGGQSLYEAKQHQHPRIYAFPSGVDVQHFAQARDRQEEPQDQVGIPHPRLGYCGVIDERFDIPLLTAVAQLKPDWHWVMIGPVVKIDPATLPSQPNIHYLGARSYDVLPSYFSGWDVGILPFARNDSTKFISPTKTPEYLAAGLPVVSTSIRDVARPYGDLGLAHITDDPAQFVADCEVGMKQDVNDPQWRARSEELLKTKSWDAIWSQMNSLIEEVVELGAESQAPINSNKGAEAACTIS